MQQEGVGDALPGAGWKVARLDEVMVRAGDLVQRRVEGWTPLDTSRVEWALAADVGEPEGVLAVVVDLVLRSAGDGTREVLRLHAEPGEEARALARAVEQAVGAKRCSVSLRSAAEEGRSRRWVPDLEALDEANRQWLRAATPR